MATDLEKLVVQLSADFKSFEKAMARAQGVSNKQFNAIERRARQMNKNLDGIFSRTFRGLTAPLAGIGAALGTREIIRLADTWTDLNSRVALAAGGMEQGADVMQRLGEVARRTYSSLEQTAEGYLLNATAMRELGYSTSQTLDYTEAVNNALVISGAKGQRAEAVMNALSKAMAGGKLSGDNLNTVIEQGGRLAEALAEGLGVGVNQLRALGSQGKITGRDIVRSLSTQMERLRREAEEMPATISDGVQLLQNALLEYVGNADQATGVSAKISEALVIMADNFDKTADVALQLAGVLAGALVGRSLLKMISTLGLAGSALVNFTRALSAARTMAGLATAFGGLGAAAGPVGLLIGGAVTAAVVAYSGASSTATERTESLKAEMRRLGIISEEAAPKVDELGQKIEEMIPEKIIQRLKDIDVELKRLESREIPDFVQDLQDIMSGNRPGSLGFDEDLDKAARKALELVEAFQRGEKDANDVSRELKTLASIPLDGHMRALIAAMQDAFPYMEGLVELSRQINIAQAMPPDPGTWDRGSRIEARQDELKGDAWEKEQLRRAALGKQQLALENEIAKVRKEADDADVKRTDDQIKRIAEANLAGNASRSKEGKKPKEDRDAKAYENLTKRIREQTDALLAENSALAAANPLVNDYGRAVTEATMAQDLLTAAKKAGAAGASEFSDVQQLLKGDLDQMSPAARELAEKIRELVRAYADADVAGQKLSESQDRLRQTAEDFKALGQDVLGGFIKDLRDGKSAADALQSALAKVADRLLDMALTGFFSGKGVGGGGLFGGMLIPGILHKGGVAGRDGYGHGRAVSPSTFAGAKRYHRGGIAGLMPGEIPAILQKGEIVLPRGAKMGGGQSIVINAPINAPGADAAALARVEASVKELGRSVPKMVDQRVNTRQTRGTRP